MNLEELAHRYLTALRDGGTSERTLYTYGRDIDQILAFFGSDREIDTIRKTEVGKFLKSDELLALPKGGQRAPQTVKKTIRVLRMVFLFAQQEGWLEETPLPKGVWPTRTRRNSLVPEL